MVSELGKLLVVDDEEDLAEFVMDVADDVGFDADILTDPKLFKQIYSADINVFIFDLYMPGVDGIELLRYLAEVNSRAVVIFMSGKDKSVLKAAQELAKSLNVLVLGGIEKPFRAAELEEILMTYQPPEPEPEVVITVEDDSMPTIKDIEEALEKRQFHMVYQPQVRFRDFSLAGAEALIRWIHPVKGFIPPDVFIPLTEQAGLIHELTWYVAQEVFEQLHFWNGKGLNLRVSINVSPCSFQHLDFPEKLERLAQFTNVRPGNIMIETTETAVMDDVSRYIDVLTRLSMKGFKLSIDDFGTGYSSLLQLVRVSFNELKIDKEFIQNLNTDKDCLAITEVSLMLAQKLGMSVVAEGIEDEVTWNYLRDMGCQEAQGYWITKPLNADDFFEWAENWQQKKNIPIYAD